VPLARASGDPTTATAIADGLRDFASIPSLTERMFEESI
jgi:hypothetical protein